MSYDVYWVKNRAEKIADFEHPTFRAQSNVLYRSLYTDMIFISAWALTLSVQL